MCFFFQLEQKGIKSNDTSDIELIRNESDLNGKCLTVTMGVGMSLKVGGS